MDLNGIIEGIRRAGITSVRAVTEELNHEGIRAARGGAWHPTAVAGLLTHLQQYEPSSN
jgi:hypothetical protein